MSIFPIAKIKSFFSSQINWEENTFHVPRGEIDSQMASVGHEVDDPEMIAAVKNIKMCLVFHFLYTASSRVLCGYYLDIGKGKIPF
jgi:hypothetical protein